MKKILIFIMAYSVSAFGQHFEIVHDPGRIETANTGDGFLIRYTGITDISDLVLEPGDPDLPAYTYRVLLSQSETVTDFRLAHQNWELVREDVNLSMHEPLWRQDAAPYEIRPEEAASSDFPSQNIQYTGTQQYHGFPIAHFLVFPFRYEKEGGKLFLLKNAQFEINTSAVSAEPVNPARQFREDFLKVKGQLKGLVANTADVETITGDESRYETFSESVYLHNSVRYIIITNEALKGAFLTLAEWKTEKGEPAVIKTVESIRMEYPDGLDDADRIRQFIKEYYDERGTRYVLFGGDTDVVPTRVITTGYYTFPTDYYYADIDGSWNTDQDEIFGEASDKLQGYPEVYVGRIPVRTIEEVDHFLNKLFRYEKAERVEDPGFFSRVLYLAANLQRDYDGRDLILNHIDPQIDPSFDRVMITQNDDVGTNPAPAMNQLNKNFGLIFSECHGSYHTVRPGAKGSNIYNYMIEEVTNPEPGIWYMASCETNDILRRSFAEAYILAGSGGGVAYIGNSSWEYPFSGIYLQKEFFRLVFKENIYHLGEAHFLSRLPYLGHITGEGPARVIVFSTLILGDPEMPVWTEQPREFVVEAPENLRTGFNAFAVHVSDQESGLPLGNTRVVLYQKNGIYLLSETNGEGSAVFDVSIAHPDSIMLTVIEHNYRPWQRMIPVSQENGYRLELIESSMMDPEGNLNRQCEPGEELELNLKLKNLGNTTLESVITAEIGCRRSPLTMIDSLILIPDKLNPGEETLAGPFRFRIAPDVFKDTTVVLDIRVMDEVFNMQGSFTLDIPVKVAEIQLDSVSVSSESDAPGLTRSYVQVNIRNTGSGKTGQVKGLLTGISEGGTIVQDVVHYGYLESGESKQGRERFIILHSQSLDSVYMVLQVSDENGRIWRRRIDFRKPEVPGKMSFVPSASNGVELHWSPVPDPDISGYLLYRKEEQEDRYQCITAQPVQGAGYYVDNELQAGHRYQYRIQSVDSSGNRSIQSQEPLSAWTSLSCQSGFPVHLDLLSIGSERNGVAVHDVDGDRYPEIIASGANGLLQILNHDGTPASEVFTLNGNLNIPAIGNVCGDDQVEVVVSAYSEGLLNNAVFIIDPVSATVTGTLDLGYNAPTHVVLSDLNADGRDEIIFVTHAFNAPVQPKNSRLSVWQFNGTEWIPFDGWSAEGYIFSSGHCLGTPGVADLDGSGSKSIIVGTTGSQIFRFQSAESTEPVWKKSLAGQLNSPVSIADLDNDGTKEIFLTAPGADKLFVLTSDGAYFPGWENGKDIEATDPWAWTSPAIAGNLDDDSDLEIAFVGRQQAYAFDPSGNLLQGWPVVVNNGNSYLAGDPKPWGVYSSPVLGDMDMNGHTDLVYLTSNGMLNGVEGISGKPIVGFPIDIRNSMIYGQSPVIADLDLDGDLEVLLVGHDGIVMSWDAPESWSGDIMIDWPCPMANHRNTGEYQPLKVNYNPDAIGEQADASVTERFILYQNYPNPFNSRTMIRYTVGSQRAMTLYGPAPMHVDLSIYNILGQKIATLVSEKQPPGRYQVQWDAGASANGVYFYKLFINAEFEQTRKLLLLK